jgi:NAD(P)H-dependent FMN reductase
MKITAITGSYRKGGMTDSAIDAILAAAREAGAETRKIYLIDEPIEFCRNCRRCMQAPGDARGPCVLGDSMGHILDEIEASDAIVLGSPVNFGTVTAVMKRFIERLACEAYWPWGAPAPRMRKARMTKRAVLVSSSAAPALLARLMMPIMGLMTKAANVLGARVIGTLFIGLAAGSEQPTLPARARRKARRLGKMLAEGAAAPGAV